MRTTTLTARASFSWAFVGSRTALRKVEISGLTGGETAKVTCTGKGCPFKSKTYKNLKKGKKSLSSRFGLKRKLSKGAKVQVQVTKPRPDRHVRAGDDPRPQAGPKIAGPACSRGEEDLALPA